MSLLSHSDREEIYYFLIPFNIISIIGCLFILSIYLIFKPLHQFAFKLIFFLSVFDLGSSLAFLIPTYNSDSNDSLCQTQSILLNLFSGLGIQWTAFIAVALYKVIVKNTMVPEKNLKFVILFIILLNLIVTAIPLSTNSYGITLGWCWIKYQTNYTEAPFIERLGLFFIPLWIIIVFNAVLYTVLLKKSSVKIENPDIVKNLKKKLRFYPLILIICYFPYTLKVVFEITGSQMVLNNEKIFTVFSGVFRSMLGFFNAIVYGSTKQVKNLIWRKVHLEGKLLVDGDVVHGTNSQELRQGSQYTVFSAGSLE